MRNGKANYIKVGTRIPPEAHLALGVASLSTGKSKSVLVSELIERRFRCAGKEPLQCLKPKRGIVQTWNRVSVFLPVTLRDKAEQEIQRQLGLISGKHAPFSLAGAIAALVVDDYGPKRKI